MNELALFAGAGGGILGGHLLGWRCVCAVEYDHYARSVLMARQNDGCLPPFPIWDDVRTFDGRPWHGRVDVVSGGFPCQDISCAGKGAGITGERSGLWSEMARIIGEVRPRFVWVENSPMLVRRGLAVVLGDLAEMGFDAWWGVVGAHHAGAPHKRDRIWVLAYANGVDDAMRRNAADATEEVVVGGAQPGGGKRNRGKGRATGAGESSHVAYAEVIDGRSGLCRREAREVDQPANSGSDVSDARWLGLLSAEKDEELAGRGLGFVRDGDGGVRREQPASGWWGSEPDVGRVAHGVAARVDRLRCIGNGQVPRVVQLAWGELGGGT